MQEVCRIAVVGLGATSISFLAQLINRCKGDRPLCITVFDKSEHPPGGTAYNVESANLILNMRADTMSIWPDQPQHFYQNQKHFTEQKFAADDYPARAVFRNYLEWCWGALQGIAAAKGVELELIKAEVTNVVPRTDGQKLIVTSHGERLFCEVCVIAIGNLPPDTYQHLRGAPGYLHAPYTELGGSNLGKVQRIGILGSSLTAIDLAIHLTADLNYQGKIFLCSRRGLLPGVQSPAVEPIDFAGQLPEGDELSLAELMRFFAKQLGIDQPDLDWQKLWPAATSVDTLKQQIAAAQSGQSAHWQSVLVGLSRQMPRLWQKLLYEAQELVWHKYYSLWCSYRHGMPLVNANKILAMLKTGQLQVLSEIANVQLAFQGFQISCQEHKAEVDLLLNATGSGMDLLQQDCRLTNNLQKAGLLKAHNCGGAWVSTEDCQLLDQDLKPVTNTYFIGPLTRGVYFYTNALEMNALQAQAVVNSILNQL